MPQNDKPILWLAGGAALGCALDGRKGNCYNPRMRLSQRQLITIGIALGIFLSALDNTIVGTALPTVVASLGGVELYSWIFAAYMLTSTTSTPVFGKLSDLFGQKALFAVAIVLFLLGSALSGSAQTMAQLILFRALQGLGGGGLMATAFTIVGHVFTPMERPKMQGILSAMWAISSIIGPAIGGTIVDHLSWRWIFYVNVPIGIIPVVLVLTNLQDTKREEKKPAIDFVGAACLSASIVSLLFALLEAGDLGWTSFSILGLFALAAVLLAVFIWNESRVPEPIVPLFLFGLRAFSVSNLSNFLSGAALFSITGFVPLFVQGVLGDSATSAGFALMPLSLAWTLGSVAGGHLVNRLGYRNLGIIGMAMMVAGFYLLTGMGVDSTAVLVGRNMFFAGLGMGLLTPVVSAAVQNAVPRSHMGVASSSVNFYRTIGGTLGVSIMGTVLNSQMLAWSSRLLDGNAVQSISTGLRDKLGDPQILLSRELSSQLPPAVLSAVENSLAKSLDTVFMAGLLMLVVGLAVITLMPHSTPAKDLERMARASALNSDSGHSAQEVRQPREQGKRDEDFFEAYLIFSFRPRSRSSRASSSYRAAVPGGAGRRSC